MQKNDLLMKENIIRVLEIESDKLLAIDCIRRTMPKWVDIESVKGYEKISEEELLAVTGFELKDIESVSAKERKFAHEHYTMIAGALPFIDDERKRSEAIKRISVQNNISPQTIRKYLCLYLVYQNMNAFIPDKKKEKALTADEKNMRWALNKFFYTKNKNSLKTAYTFMLKEKYCDKNDELKKHPSFYQFRYFYRKHRKLETVYISRNGIKDYQRNNRPLLGNGIQDFAPNVGVGMLDSTICDIYLVNEEGELVGRPILTACIDAYSSLCCGYVLSWEGGIYSLKQLMMNIICDKVQWCKKFGITVNENDWDCSKLPATLVTDMGNEYKSSTFEQITDIGVKVVNLPAYRPDLKGAVEKFFDVIQNLYKSSLIGKGVIEADFQERGAHDYRRDACLTLKDFEKIILRCIIYYNSKKIIENFPYIDKMIKDKVKPYASSIWNWGRKEAGANLIKVTAEELILTMLPRTEGKFTRSGLKVNKLRYNNDAYTERYLKGENAIVAYDVDDVNAVWLVEDGRYIQFELIENRFSDKTLDEVEMLKEKQRNIISAEQDENLQARIELIEHIKSISENANNCNIGLHDIRKTRKKEQLKYRIGGI